VTKSNASPLLLEEEATPLPPEESVRRFTRATEILLAARSRRLARLADEKVEKSAKERPAVREKLPS
jgi:hypothetical protein